MRRLAATAACIAALASPRGAAAQSVALSFEDAPAALTPLLGARRAETLTATLATAGVKEALFLALGRNVTAQGGTRLAPYTAAGHILGSQGYSGETVDELGASAFVQDIKRNDELVRDLPGFHLWLRFPALAEGRTVETRDTVRIWIYHMLYGRAHVTVDTPDAELDRLVQAGLRAGRSLDTDRLRAFYVGVLMDCVRHYDAMARRVLGYSPPHTLRLHENDLAALFVADFVAALRRSGGKVITASAALLDPINAYEADVVPLEGSQILAIARERGIGGVTPAPLEEPAALAAAFDAAHVWQP
jgi:peptidoglycan/xylan/chitin deacetylase (PgdA/CDA1 family)